MDVKGPLAGSEQDQLHQGENDGIVKILRLVRRGSLRYERSRNRRPSSYSGNHDAHFRENAGWESDPSVHLNKSQRHDGEDHKLWRADCFDHRSRPPWKHGGRSAGLQ
jgi:hypothetical protein